MEANCSPTTTYHSSAVKLRGGSWQVNSDELCDFRCRLALFEQQSFICREAETRKARPHVNPIWNMSEGLGLRDAGRKWIFDTSTPITVHLVKAMNDMTNSG